MSRFVSGELGRHSEFPNDGVCNISRSRSFPWCICRRRELVRRSRLGALQVRNCAIADYVIAHIDEPIEVSTLEDSGAQPVPFTRLLTRFVGVSPHRYVVHLRWQRVVELVRHVRSGLADVAVRTAFADQAISRVGSGASTAFPRRNWSPEPKEQESSRSAAPSFLNRGPGARNYRVRAARPGRTT